MHCHIAFTEEDLAGSVACPFCEGAIEEEEVINSFDAHHLDVKIKVECPVCSYKSFDLTIATCAMCEYDEMDKKTLDDLRESHDMCYVEEFTSHVEVDESEDSFLCCGEEAEFGDSYECPKCDPEVALMTWNDLFNDVDEFAYSSKSSTIMEHAAEGKVYFTPTLEAHSNLSCDGCSYIMTAKCLPLRQWLRDFFNSSEELSVIERCSLHQSFYENF
jgi:hypothetical protein